jgi:hypothetical protein
LIALAQASIGLGDTHMQRASAGLAFQVLQPVAVLKANRMRFAANVRPIIDEIMRAGATSPDG